MSGFEVLGVILALPPVIIMALDFYKGKLEVAKDWWHIKKTMKELRREIVLQEVYLRNNVEQLLQEIAESEVDMDVKEICNDLDAALRKSPDLKRKIEDHLEDANEPYMELFNQMKIILQEIERILAIQGGSIPTADPARLKQQVKAMKIAVKKKYILQQTEQLHDLNEKLRILLKDASNLAPIRRKKKISRAAQAFWRVRQNAQSLYAALSRCWTCNCGSEEHVAGLVLAHHVLKAEDGSVSFNVCLGTNDGDWHETVIRSTPLGQASIEIQQGGVSQQITMSAVSTQQSVQGRVVRFQDQSAESMTAQHQVSSTSIAISDLCHELALSQPKHDVGRVVTKSGQCHMIRRTSKPMSKYDHLKLHEILGASARANRISRGRRMLIAARCAQSLLQLYETPWTKKGIRSSNVMFLVSQSLDATTDAFQTEKPLIYAGFPRQPAVIPPDLPDAPEACTDEATRCALQELAIILLELCFGRLLEEHLFYKKLELFNQAEAIGAEDLNIRLVVANTWHKGVVGEEGQVYSDIVRRCLDCNFGCSRTNLDDAEFRQLVWDNVFEPLKIIASNYGEWREESSGC